MNADTLDQAIRTVRAEFKGVFAVSCLINLLALTTSIYMLQIFDRVLTGQSYATLGYLTLIAIVAIAALAVMELARKRVLARAGHWFEAAASPQVVAAAGDDCVRRRQPEATLQDVVDVRSFVAGDGITAFFDAPWLPIFLAVLFLLHPWIGIIAACGALALFLCALLNDGLTRRAADTNRTTFRQAQTTARELQENTETLQAMGMRPAALARLRAHQLHALPGVLGMLDTGAAVASLSRFVRLALQVAVLGAGAFLVLEQQLTAGGMIAGSILLSRALAPVEKSIQGWRGYQSARTGLSAIKKLLSRRETIDRQVLPAPRGEVDVNELTYVPGTLDQPVLRNITFRLPPGGTLGVVGPTGSGKSTLCRLLAGTQAPSSGHVRIDGADVVENVEQLGASIGYVSQEVSFLTGTVAENIARLAVGAENQVIEAAQRAGVHELILSLPEGYETDMGALGPRLSGGQRQRLALARAFYRDPALLILDEPNSSLDQAGEAALVEALDSAKARGKTIVLVSHRMALLRVCDTLMVLNQGQVVKRGPRAEVMQLYAARRDTAEKAAE